MRLRRWKGRTKVLQTTSRYSAVAIALHWVIALLIVANIALGLGHELFGRANELAIMAAHKSIGLTILALSLLRLAWRVSHRPPPLPAAMPGWQVLAARATHLFFYVAIIALPLTGWLTASASPLRFPLEYFGMFQLPFLPVEQSRSATGLWSEAHEILAFTTIAVLGLHIAGALKHQFFDRDDVLARMLPKV